MSLDKNLTESLIDITSKAAISCYPHLGKGNKILEYLAGRRFGSIVHAI